ncbi:Uncharacterised protein [Mycobacteroides abscessus subsp. abscessus]|nr:Uncharacterised protein [Mycobacteroides abscessus subsp. abscessus]
MVVTAGAESTGAPKILSGRARCADCAVGAGELAACTFLNEQRMRSHRGLVSKRA